MERLAVRAALRRVAYSVRHAHVLPRQSVATTATICLRHHFTEARSRPRARSSPSPRSANTRASRGADDADDDGALGQDETAESIRQLVREAVLAPLGKSDAHTHSPVARSPAAAAAAAAAADDSAVYQVNVFDRNGMPAELPSSAPQSFDDLLRLTPDPLRRQLQEMMEKKHWTSLTGVQKHVVPFVLEYRDVLCIAPTATGKTFAYVFPTMLRLLLDQQQEQKTHTRLRSSLPSGHGGEDGEESLLQRRDVERLLQEKINKGEVCRYCELDVRENRVCPMTGSLHAPPQEDGDEGDAFMDRARRAQRLDELSSTASPKVLVLVPTSQLAYQVHGVFQMLNCDVTIRYLVRASSADEQRKHLIALQDGVDVLITTPETLLPALFKRKLSLQQVRTIVMDEVDDLVSVNHYDKLKIILGALPRASDAVRPQRLLFGASLPPAAYKMLTERTLQPSHRFILADVHRDNLGRPVTASRVIVQHNNSNPALASGTSGSGVVGSSLATTAGHTSLITVNASIQHIVMMLGRVEKLHKLAWLYQTGKLTCDQRVIIFCNSRHNVAYIADHLPRLVPELSHITTITSHASSTARAGVMRQFTSGLSTCLVATDIMSRGIDFKDVVYVVNYDMPLDMETFVHRCGRCGRRQPSQWMSSGSQQQLQRMPRKGKSERTERHESTTTDALDDLDTQMDADSEDTSSPSSLPSALSQLPPALTRGTSGYVYTFFQPENVKLAKPLVAYLRQNGQLVPPVLNDYARRSFVDVFKNSLFHQPTRPYRKSDPQNSMPVDGRAAPRYPDYKQDALNRHFRPL